MQASTLWSTSTQNCRRVQHPVLLVEELRLDFSMARTHPLPHSFGLSWVSLPSDTPLTTRVSNLNPTTCVQFLMHRISVHLSELHFDPTNIFTAKCPTRAPQEPPALSAFVEGRGCCHRTCVCARNILCLYFLSVYMETTAHSLVDLTILGVVQGTTYEWSK